MHPAPCSGKAGRGAKLDPRMFIFSWSNQRTARAHLMGSQALMLSLETIPLRIMLNEGLRTRGFGPHTHPCGMLSHWRESLDVRGERG